MPVGRELFVVLNYNLEDIDRDNDFHSSFADLSIQYRHTFRFYRPLVARLRWRVRHLVQIMSHAADSRYYR